MTPKERMILSQPLKKVESISDKMNRKVRSFIKWCRFWYHRNEVKHRVINGLLHGSDDLGGESRLSCVRLILIHNVAQAHFLGSGTCLGSEVLHLSLKIIDASPEIIFSPLRFLKRLTKLVLG